MNQALYGSASYRVPQRVLDGIRQALGQHPGQKGTERAQGLLRDPEVSYSALKAIKADLDAPGAARQPAYELCGGRAMLAWANQALSIDRQSVERSKTTRTNAGLTNQFRKAYERRDTPAPTSLGRRADDHGAPIRRQQLNENTPPMPTPFHALAEALIGTFPELQFTKNDATGEVTITTEHLTIVVQSATGELEEGWLQSAARKVALAGAIIGSSTQMPHAHAKTQADVERNQNIESYEQAAKFAKRRETEAVVNRMTNSVTNPRPVQPHE